MPSRKIVHGPTMLSQGQYFDESTTIWPWYLSNLSLSSSPLHPSTMLLFSRTWQDSWWAFYLHHPKLIWYHFLLLALPLETIFILFCHHFACQNLSNHSNYICFDLWDNCTLGTCMCPMLNVEILLNRIPCYSFSLKCCVRPSMERLIISLTFLSVMGHGFQRHIWAWFTPLMWNLKHHWTGEVFLKVGT